MKKIFKICRSSLLLGALIFVSSFVNAQSTADLSKMLQTTQQDASKLIGAYSEPVIKAVSYGMTGGWYHTGKTHDKFGVDLGVTISTVFIPKSDYYFNPGSLGLSASTTYNGNTTNPGLGAPTFVGPKDATSYSATYDPDGGGPLPSQSINFNGPEGLDLKKSIGFAAAPVPMVQLGFGLWFNTDIKLRYLPRIKSNESNVQMLGVGLMHDIKQWIPGVKELPFDLSVLAAFTSFTGSTNLATGPNNDGRPVSNDGKISYKLNSWVGQVVISKKLSVVTFYLGAGYGAVNTNVDVTGTFDIVGSLNTFQIKDPAKIKFSNNGLKVTGGMRLKFGPIYLVGDYTLQKYSAFVVGLGASIR